MKRLLTTFLALSMILLLAACGAAGQPDAEAPASVETTEGPKLVTGIDDFLAAIQPGATILLAEGDFRMEDASDYGKSVSPYYTWNDLGGGEYELWLQNIDGLTIQGLGQKKTSITAEPRWANVLTLLDCKNVSLSGMTLGHTEQTEACEGGVLRLERSQNTTLQDLGLYGCGTLGVLSYQCTGLAIQDCDIYDCSIGGIQLSETTLVTVNASAFHSLGKESPVNHVFSIYGGDEIIISNCMISNNYVDNLVQVHESGSVIFRSNQFVSNKIASAAFSLWKEGVVLDSNVFEDMEPRSWYVPGGFCAVDGDGLDLIFDEPSSEPMAVTPGTAAPVSTGAQTEVRVKTADEFLKALAPDTCIILESETIDLSTAQSYQAAQKELANSNEFQPIYEEHGAPYYWVDNHDGPSLVIFGISNLTIRSESQDRKAHTLSAVPRYANVLTFENCSAITVENLTAGHTIEPGYCMGGVLQFRNCENVLVNNCGLFGCGTIGVDAITSRGLQVVNCEIYECSYNAVQLYSCEDVAISGTAIWDIGDDTWGPSPFFSFHDSKNITLDGQDIDGNYVGN